MRQISSHLVAACPRAAVLSAVLSAAIAIVAACASTPPPAAVPTTATATTAAPVVEEPPPPDHPRTWADVPDFYGTTCPGPDFVLDTPMELDAAGSRWRLRGSVLEKLDERDANARGPVVLGVLGAIKDASPDTRANLEKAKKEFARAHVSLVVCNGDVAETQDIHDVAVMLGEVFGDDVPVLVHSGNVEWTSSFQSSFFELAQTHPGFFNGNLIRDVDLGGVHVLSLPGWSNHRFVKEGACRSGKADIEALRARAQAVQQHGDVVVLSAHGPPRGDGRQALDFAHDAGNVGDDDLAALLGEGTIRFGLFSHILEAGGRATSDVDTHAPLPLPMKKPARTLFVNVGSASAFGWQMLDGKTSRGLAAVVTIDHVSSGGDATVRFVKLRP